MLFFLVVIRWLVSVVGSGMGECLFCHLADILPFFVFDTLTCWDFAHPEGICFYLPG